LVHQLVLFFSNVYHFPDPSVYSFAFSVDHLGVVPVCDVVEKDDVVCDCRLVESNRMDRWIREAINIRKEPDKSMNQDEGSYQLPHIYDYLLSATATPGGQSFERRQQRLPKRQRKQ